MERSEGSRLANYATGSSVAPAGRPHLVDPAYNWAEANGLGLAWEPRKCGPYPLDLDGSLRFTRFAKNPTSENPYPNPATFPDGLGVGAFGCFMPMLDAFAKGISFGKSPYGPGVNSIPRMSTLYNYGMVQFPTLQKRGG